MPPASIVFDPGPENRYVSTAILIDHGRCVSTGVEAGRESSTVVETPGDAFYPAIPCGSTRRPFEPPPRCRRPPDIYDFVEQRSCRGGARTGRVEVNTWTSAGSSVHKPHRPARLSREALVRGRSVAPPGLQDWPNRAEGRGQQPGYARDPKAAWQIEFDPPPTERRRREVIGTPIHAPASRRRGIRRDIDPSRFGCATARMRHSLRPRRPSCRAIHAVLHARTAPRPRRVLASRSTWIRVGAPPSRAADRRSTSVANGTGASCAQKRVRAVNTTTPRVNSCTCSRGRRQVGVNLHVDLGRPGQRTSRAEAPSGPRNLRCRSGLLTALTLASK